MPRKAKTVTDENNIKTESERALSLEEAFTKLDQIIGGLEEENVSLEDSFKLYHEGMEMLKNCNQSIDKVEKELMILEESMNG